MTEQTQEATNSRGTRKVMQGIVVSDGCDKTIVVQVERTTRHPLYHKILRKRRKFHVHDEANGAKVGDKVEIMGTRPLSKLKRWRLVRIIEAGSNA
jgi:small subunit ribosomal protein S17